MRGCSGATRVRPPCLVRCSSRARGDVVNDLRNVNLVGNRLIMFDEARLFGLVVVRRDEKQSVSTDVGRPAGEFERFLGVVRPDPAMTGTSSTASMTASTTSMCSSWESVADSPVEPTGTSPSTPADSSRWASSLSVSKSILPSRCEWRPHRWEHAVEVNRCHCCVSGVAVGSVVRSETVRYPSDTAGVV